MQRPERTEREAASTDLIVCDTGGTTFDVCLVAGGEITHAAETWLGGRWIGHITGIRAVDVKSIGAGGGSIVWIDPGGLLRVGPRSAGADPGPACYGRGGTQPTITDAAVVLGWIDPDYFLGGRLPLDADAAHAVIEEAVAAPLGMGVHEAAYAALTIASENIVGAIREITIMQGIDPRAVTLVAGGGASGLTIVPIARELGCPRVLAPSTASALSACGALFADVVSEFPQSRYAETRSLDREAVNATLRDVAARADDFLDGLAGLPVLETRKDFSVEARYRAQVWELDVPVPQQLESDEDVRAVEEAFHATHERIFAVREPGQYLECLLWKARATAVLEKPTIRRPSAACRTGRRRIDGHGVLQGDRAPARSPVRRRIPVGRHAGPRPGDHPGTDHDDRRLPGVGSGRDGARQLHPRAHDRERHGSVEQRRAGAGAVSSFDPVTLAVIANRLDSIVREMENTLLRTGRSAVLNMARDFSCALITADNRLLASAEGLPVHVIGMEFLAEAVTDLHADLTEGDAFLHNDPYLGNTHPADHVILVPVFWEGRHVFTAAAKAHQADCGNAQPTTYMPYARDVYEEGSLIFPAVRVQRDYEDIEDVIRMCRRRIRVPDQWYGDYLAMVGAARIGEARLKEVCARYGAETVAGVRRGVVRLLRAVRRARHLDACRRARSSARGCTTRSGRRRTASRSGSRSRSIPRPG